MRIHIPVVFWHGRSFNLVTFGLFAAVGSFLGFSIAFFYLQTRGLDVHRFCWELASILVICNLLFAKVFYIFSLDRTNYLQNLGNYLNETSYYQQGGIIGFVVGTLLLHALTGIPVILLGDALTLGGIATIFTGRLGCLNYGCCTGIPAQGWFAVTYTDPEAKICREKPRFRNVPLIPVQLIAAAVDFFLFLLCCTVAIRFSYSGMIIVIFFLGVNLKRLVLQTYRYKDSSNKMPYQWIAVGLILAVVMIVWFVRNPGEPFFAPEIPVTRFNAGNYFRFLFSDLSVTASLSFIGILNFAAYGIHGRRLGTHFNLS
jgi:prolipoprotein diacylglyceryltransferase